jgi:hypothetical protein
VAGSAVLVPIIVAVIGVVGTIVPIYTTSSTAELVTRVSLLPEHDNKSYFVLITNRGDVPATNISITIRSCLALLPCEFKIHTITNGFSNAKLFLPQSNKTLEPGKTETVNQSIIEIQTAKLVHGQGSAIRLSGITNSSENDFIVSTLSDQGSARLIEVNPQNPYTSGDYATFPKYVQEFIKWYNNHPMTSGDIHIPLYLIELIQWFDENVAPLAYFFLVFYSLLFVIILVYFMRRKANKKFLTTATNNIMEVRRTLLKDHTYKDKLSDAWSNVPVSARRRIIKDMANYLLIDDFYSQLEGRNQYLEKNMDKEKSDLSRANALSKHNEAVLAAAENALNKVNWNKYR